MKAPTCSRPMKRTRISMRALRLGKPVSLVGALALGFLPGWGQSPAATGQSSLVPSSSTSMANSLQKAGNNELHIFYVHGIGAGGPDDFDSNLLRKSICKFLKDCVTTEGRLEGTDYADQHIFALNAPPPTLAYFGKPVWSSDASGRSEEWNASAPYVDHWKLERRNAPAVYVDEIDWWPLVFALKCRQIIAEDAVLAGPQKAYLDLCSKSEADNSHPGRYRLYPWISAAESQRLKALPARGARVNRNLKNSLLDWGLADALMAVGPMQPLLLEGIRQLVLKSVSVSAGSSPSGTDALADQEFVIVAHSLGSYLIFSALDMQAPQSSSAELKEWQKEFNAILSRTSVAYFLANQLRPLELASLDTKSSMVHHLETWSALRRSYLADQKSAGGNAFAPPRIVAWSDPSDVLTWTVPEFQTGTGPDVVTVKDRTIKNAPHWLWLFESPTKAHENYAANKRIIQEMLRPTKDNRKSSRRH